MVGSSNTDLVIECGKLPGVGETVKGQSFRRCQGGKGANQAVAAARAGAKVTFIGACGDDDFGVNARLSLEREGIDVSRFKTHPGYQSGTALILVRRSDGENMIAVASAANDTLLASDIESAAGSFNRASAVLCQLEIPIQAVEAAAAMARAQGIPFILNPAPAKPLPERLYQSIFAITPNQGEAKILTGDSEYPAAARRLLERGCRNVVITLGREGAYGLNHSGEWRFACPSVRPVDTVGAGDCFSGYLAAGLAEGLLLPEAMRMAIEAASISVTRLGAQDSFPFRDETAKPVSTLA